MKQFFITVAGVVVGFLLVIVLPIILLAVIGMGAAMSGADKPNHGNSQVLRLDLRSPMTDQGRPGIFQNTPSLIHLVETLSAAERDENVKGLFIRANPFGMQPAQAEEIRMALKSFQHAGKFVIVHAQGFEGTTVTSYLSVSAADELWLQDTSSFVATGLATESAFYGGVFEKIKAKPEFEQFYEYKSAANTYTQKTFTEAHRRSTLSWATSIFDSAMDQIAEDRDMSREALQALTDTAPMSAERAVETGLADKLGHVVEAREAALARAGDGNLVEIGEYEAPAAKSGKYPLVAVIEGEGAIVTGEGSSSPFSNDSGIHSDQMAEAIIEATDNEKVKAILIRVDSPGGSAIASDQIWNAIERAKAKDKKIIISMGQLAASGGYYIAAGADAIVAYPTTLTGSIGVLGGKIVLDDTFEMVGYNVEQLKVGGEFAGAYSASKSFTETQRAAFRANMADTYEDFTSKVAAGRDLPLERVLEIAKGRVWTGAQALDIGLVDELGGYMAAIAKTKELIGVEADDKISLRRFPAPKSEIEQFYEMFGLSTEAAKTMAKLQVLTDSEQVQALIKVQQMIEQRPAELQAHLPAVH
jgi:protease-4